MVAQGAVSYERGTPVQTVVLAVIAPIILLLRKIFPDFSESGSTGCRWGAGAPYSPPGWGGVGTPPHPTRGGGGACENGTTRKFQVVLPGSQGQNLVVTVLHVLCLLERGLGVFSPRSKNNCLK